MEKNYVHNEILILSKIGCTYSSVLEEGDYIPYFVHKRTNNFKTSIQNSAGKPNLFIIIDFCDKKIYNKYTGFDIPTYIICKNTTYSHSRIINDTNIHKLFPSGFILTTPNLKIHKIFNNIKNIK